MSVAIPDLWPAEVDQSDVLSPLVILRHQAGLLRQRTGNVLEADVVTESDPESNDVCHGLELIVPALRRLRVRLVNVVHDEAVAYPVTIVSGVSLGQAGRRAGSQSEFIHRLGEVLGSEAVRGTIQTVFAQAKEARATPRKPKA